MCLENVTLRLEESADFTTIETVTAKVFGPGMQARAAHALREGVDHDLRLSFVAELADEIIGTVRLTPVLIGDETCWILGPLGVLPELKSRGVGKMLMRKAVSEAGLLFQQGAGYAHIVLVGDAAYYQPFGFVSAKPNSISFPRPVDQSRVLFCNVSGTEIEAPSGVARSRL